jgi:hypothetical protein
MDSYSFREMSRIETGVSSKRTALKICCGVRLSDIVNKSLEKVQDAVALLAVVLFYLRPQKPRD